MNIYLITYDLNKPGQHYSELYVAIKNFGGWIHPLDSTWFVRTNASLADIRDFLARTVDNNDKIFVTALNGWASWNTPSLNEWLKA